ncbi:PIN domain-like protein [Saccharata proteae CBS 121410]|uniref:PIN domain-like protein n=1 Tax=Saccharata proteae CBS 121410 TaxID=1314787 RepID=A0A9P4HR31_9PEZI|nr:PIN domain-like protein [Saccharata proteae CBS 121410]
MGVTGLWTVVQPCARPIKIETLNKKRLAVDASIWIYQFLKAVRDKEGNALRNSHVVGFFRRICKLLFIGIKPVFVFDGGAPTLKRQTIAGRKQRREGRREDAVRTAAKLLTVQMQRAAEEEERRRKEAPLEAEQKEEEPLPENLVYADEVHMGAQERQQTRKFRQKDAYHLPDLDVSLSEMGAPNDPRIMSLEELEQYARQFDTGEDINIYDFSKIDFDSAFFTSLPASDRYNILNAARLRSRLRMGYSKDQLDSMFQDRMAFSKFQIERVRERNELTQRLMNINNGDAQFGADAGGRVASEKGLEYVLVKNEGVEGGWALGVFNNDGERSKPIDLDAPVKEDVEEDLEDEDDFEDVPIEGLNRLPKYMKTGDNRNGPSDLSRKRQAVYASRKTGAIRRTAPKKKRTEDPESLFVGQDKSDEEEEEWENVEIDGNEDLFEEQPNDEEDAELQRAIAMSLQQEKPQQEDQEDAVDENDDFLEVFQEKAEDPKPFSKGSGLAIARMANQRSSKLAAQHAAESDSDAGDVDMQAALAESRNSKYKPKEPLKAAVAISTATAPQPLKKPSNEASKAGGFSGPLPFEKLNLGSSLLGKKKMQKINEDNSGGFEKANAQGEKKAVTLPPWFSSGGDIRDELAAQKALEEEYRRKDRIARENEFQFQEQPGLRRDEINEIIDLEAIAEENNDVIAIESSDEEADNGDEMEDVVPVDSELRMGDLADKIRAEPPRAETTETSEKRHKSPVVEEPSKPSPSPAPQKADQSEEEMAVEELSKLSPTHGPQEAAQSDREISWAPTPEPEPKGRGEYEKPSSPAGGQIQRPPSKSTSPEFETVTIGAEDGETEPLRPGTSSPSAVVDEGPVPMSGLADQTATENVVPDDESIYSDPEDEDLFRQLANEASEHARFASTLNNKPQEKNAEEYERELKQLRNQQKKDRRDADEVTQTMVTECQQLLALFGLPYITAPMEAEAQCAELVQLGLVDGIVTDDSDIFLFGGTRVYKNMFNQAKYVECYLTQDLEAEFGLTRPKLIGLAELLGSDYAEGLPGVGPVTALEIMSEFSTLKEFKIWWTEVQSGMRPKSADQDSPFRRKFRKNQMTKLFLSPNFPDPRVAEAYHHPEVDDSSQQFAWGVPDLDALRNFLMATIGWSQERTDEVLVPVIRDINNREKEGTQSNITSFFGGGVGAGAFAPRIRAEGKSKRLESALVRMGNKARGMQDADGGSAGAGDGAAGGPASDGAAQNKRKKSTRGKRTAPVQASEEDEDEDDDNYEGPPKKTRKSTKGKTTARGRGKAKA